ncbi:hypothetical protein BG011_002453 [Mortierella polycephala]|uniref:Uncharacterized protein n=1 Tax=Mortierella polycephala TaxID=41804 RepID=A0A9P6PJI1_9FUNG|nr:hypothetical protein BG011_002453 [Mortierella polycephala]
MVVHAVQALGGASMTASSSSNSMEQNPSSPSTRRRSTSHKSPEVVTADELRPDWNRRILAAAQNQAASRRASTNSSVSNATFALGRRLAAGRHAGSSSRRSNSSAAAADYSGYLTAMRNMGADLEELMIMEAMRQSLQDEHDRQTRETAAETTADASATTTTATTLTDTTHRQLTQSSGSRNRTGTEGGAAGGSSSEGLVINARSGHSSDSPLSSTTVHGTMSIEREDDAVSLTSESDDGAGSESDSDQEMSNHAIRYANVPIPASTPVERTRKHQAQEGSTPTTAPAPASSEAM